MEIVALVLVPIAALALGFGVAYAVSRREPAPRDDLLVAARREHEERLRAARSQALEIRSEAEAVARQTLTSLEEVEQRMVRREERLDSRLDGSLYELLEVRYGLRPHRARESLEPVTAGIREAEALLVDVGAPLMLVERTAYARSGEPVEFARDLFRGDRTKLVVWTSELGGGI